MTLFDLMSDIYSAILPDFSKKKKKKKKNSARGSRVLCRYLNNN